MKDLKVFENNEFGDVRVITDENNEPWFVATEVAEALGYKNKSRDINRHCKYVKILKSTETGLLEIPPRGIQIINEKDVYRLIMRSNLPAAIDFQDWIVDTVLPAIREKGGYILDKPDDTPEEIMARALLVAQDTLKRREERIKNLENKVEKDKPLVEFANHVSDTSDAIDLGTYAKVLADESINIGRNRLFKWMRREGYLQKNNIPYQRYIDMGLFKVIEQVYKTIFHDKINTKTLLTGKGQLYFLQKLKERKGDGNV